jgi:hypothetical protein
MYSTFFEAYSDRGVPDSSVQFSCRYVTVSLWASGGCLLVLHLEGAGTPVLRLTCLALTRNLCENYTRRNERLRCFSIEHCPSQSNVIRARHDIVLVFSENYFCIGLSSEHKFAKFVRDHLPCCLQVSADDTPSPPGGMGKINMILIRSLKSYDRMTSLLTRVVLSMTGFTQSERFVSAFIIYFIFHLGIVVVGLYVY